MYKPTLCQYLRTNSEGLEDGDLVVGAQGRSASTGGLGQASTRIRAQRVGRDDLDAGAATGGLALTCAVGIGLLDFGGNGLLQRVLDLGLLVLGSAATRGQVEAATSILGHHNSGGGGGAGAAWALRQVQAATRVLGDGEGRGISLVFGLDELTACALSEVQAATRVLSHRIGLLGRHWSSGHGGCGGASTGGLAGTSTGGGLGFDFRGLILGSARAHGQGHASTRGRG